MTIESTVLGPGFAAEIVGVDLRDELSDAAVAEIKHIWLENKLAVFRDQQLNDDELVRFTERFGPLFVHFRSQFNDASRPEIMLVSNLKENGRNLGELGDGDLAWHSDQSYSAAPVFATMLYAIEVPAEEGATWFCDTAGAYAALPTEMKERIDPLRQIFSVERTIETQNIALTEEQRMAKPPVVHPLVRTHPLLGRKSIYLSPAHSAGIMDVSDEESDALLDELTEWATRENHVYQHNWRTGDLVMWDNTSTMHRRDAFSSDARRMLKRTGFEFFAENAIPF